MPSKTTKTLADFRSKFDRSVVIPDKIRAALAALAKEGPEAWEYEGEFIKRAMISQSDMGLYRSGFEEHVVVVKDIGRSTSGNGRKVWFADKKVAAKARS